MPIGGQRAAHEQNGPSRCWERPFSALGWCHDVGVKQAIGPMRTNTSVLAVFYVERRTGLEPVTICLEGRDSTAELPPRDASFDHSL